MHATDFSNAADLQDSVAIIPGKEQCFNNNYFVSDLDSPEALATFCMQYAQMHGSLHMDLFIIQQRCENHTRRLNYTGEKRRVILNNSSWRHQILLS